MLFKLVVVPGLGLVADRIGRTRGDVEDPLLPAPDGPLEHPRIQQQVLGEVHRVAVDRCSVWFDGRAVDDQVEDVAVEVVPGEDPPCVDAEGDVASGDLPAAGLQLGAEVPAEEALRAQYECFQGMVLREFGWSEMVLTTGRRTIPRRRPVEISYRSATSEDAE